jgi:uncharacterized iron-regulated membrane protein
LRRVLFWLHLAAGTTAGVVVLVMSATGVLLAYEKQLTAWAESSYRSRLPADGTPGLGLEALVARVRGSRPDVVASAVTIRRDPDAPVVFARGRGLPLYVDRYSGEVLGEGSRPTREFFRKVEDWHRWLAVDGEGRPVGRGITGGCNLAFLFLVATGIVLWWPRERSRPALAGVTLFRTGLRGRARDFNWHNVAGFWSALPLFLIVLCAVFMSYPWATDLLYRITGSPPPPRPAPADPGPARRDPPSLEGWDRRFAWAERTVPDWRSITLRLPPPSDDDPQLTIDTGNGGRPDLRGQLVFPRLSSDVVIWQGLASQSAGRRLRTWARFVHTGEAGGIVGQTIAAAAASGAVLLVCTGLSMALRRFAAWRRRAGARQPAVAAS